MSITLNLSPELEARLRADAERQQLSIEVLVATRLDTLYSDSTEQRGHQATVSDLQGSLVGTGLELEDFLDEKRADIERENERSL